MQVIKSLVMMLGLGAFLLSTPLAAKADEWNKKTTITFNQPVEIPGMVLAPGTYVFELMDSPSDRDVVQIFNAVHRAGAVHPRRNAQHGEAGYGF